MDINIGTSGYSYDDWKGIFYPKTASSSDMLPFYAKYFHTTEVNSSYYRIPPIQMIQRIVEKVGADFSFTIKAFRGITHDRENVDATINEFNQAISPLIETGKGAGILLQFPFSFKNEEDNINYIRYLKDKFQLPIVVEFRNNSWVNEDIFKLLEDSQIGYCNVDEPDAKGLMPRIARVTSEIGYLRFHGRNTDKWFNHDSVTEKYDYLYKDDELAEWVPKIKAMAELTKKFFIFFNNHPNANAVQNAAMLAKQLGQDIKVPSANDY